MFFRRCGSSSWAICSARSTGSIAVTIWKAPPMVENPTGLKKRPAMQPHSRIWISTLCSGCSALGIKSFMSKLSALPGDASATILSSDETATLSLTWCHCNCLFRQLRRDCAFLESEGIMDYSLLVGVHFCDDIVPASKMALSTFTNSPGKQVGCYLKEDMILLNAKQVRNFGNIMVFPLTWAIILPRAFSQHAVGMPRQRQHAWAVPLS